MRCLELQEDQFHIVRSHKGMEEVTNSGNDLAFKLKYEGQGKEYIVTFGSSNSSVACNCGNVESIGFCVDIVIRYSI